MVKFHFKGSMSFQSGVFIVVCQIFASKTKPIAILVTTIIAKLEDNAFRTDRTKLRVKKQTIVFRRPKLSAILPINEEPTILAKENSTTK